MKVVGNILDITTRRDNRHSDIEVHLDLVEYTTFRKDGRYHHEFNYLDELETPLVLTGDYLARVDAKKNPDGEYDFQVYEKEGEEYILNPDKKLTLTLIYDFDEDITILSAADYMVTLPPEDFKKLETEKEKEKSRKTWKGRKKS